MSHLNIEMHLKYPYEHIDSSEYDTVHAVMERIGCTRDVIEGKIPYKLPKATYFFDHNEVSRSAIMNAWKELTATLHRRITFEVTEGASWGIGLEPRLTSPFSSLALRGLMPPPSAETKALSAIYGSYKESEYLKLELFSLLGSTKK